MTPPVLTRIPEKASVVIIRLRSLGDTVLITPALRLLKEYRPDLRTIVVSEKPFDQVLDGNRDVSRMIRVDPRKGMKERLRTLLAIRRERPQLCLNLHGGSTSAWLTALSRAKFRAGFAHFRPSLPYNVRIPRAQEILARGDNDSVHTAEHHASAMFYLGVPVKKVPPAVLCAEPERRRSAYAVVHVTAAYFTKEWPVERFRQVGKIIHDQHGLEPVMVAGPNEGRVLEQLKEFPCFDNLSIAKLKSLLAGASLFVGNDSGPAHIAAAFGVPCVVIFGSSNSAVWHPWRTKHKVVETDWDCKPCPGDRCYAFEEPRCILSVEVAQVATAIERVLAPSAAAVKARVTAD